MILQITDWKNEKKYKRLISISDLPEGKSGRYNCGERQARAALQQKLPVNHDISENKNASTDVLAMEVIDAKMDTNTTQSDVDRLHRNGKRKNIGKPRQGIINFFSV